MNMGHSAEVASKPETLVDPDLDHDLHQHQKGQDRS